VPTKLFPLSARYCNFVNCSHGVAAKDPVISLSETSKKKSSLVAVNAGSVPVKPVCCKPKTPVLKSYKYKCQKNISFGKIKKYMKHLLHLLSFVREPTQAGIVVPEKLFVPLSSLPS